MTEAMQTLIILGLTKTLLPLLILVVLLVTFVALLHTWD